MHSAHGSDGIYDSVVVNIGMEWLTQYARFLRRSPELVEGLAERPEDFELVPIPKVLLNRLAVPGIVGSGNLGDVDPEVLRFLNVDLEAIFKNAAQSSRAEALDRLHEFAAALSAGNVAGIAAWFSPGFVTPDGNTGQDVQKILEELMQSAPVRHFELRRLEEICASEADLLARVHGVWTAAAAGPSDQPLCESVCLEVLLELDAGGQWKISDLRSL